MNDLEQDAVLQALASQPRRAILRYVRAHPGCNLGTVAAQFPLSRIAVKKHVDILTATSLIVSQRVGRERLLYFNLVPIQQLHAEWADQISSFMAESLMRLKQRVEQEASRGGMDHAGDHQGSLSDQDTREPTSRMA